MRKIISILCVFFILFNLFPNYGSSTDIKTYASGGISVRSTNVWAENYKVEFGKNIKIYYRFDDEPHPVRINVYRNGVFFEQIFNYNTSYTNTLNYTSYNDEGTYKFEVRPLDAAYNFSGECTVKVYKHRVILIPGIMASELYDGNTKVWIPSSNPFTAP